MRSKPSTRYYCDFCNKGGNSASAMARHEKHCTLNPARSCRMCAMVCNDQLPMPDLLACLRPIPSPPDNWCVDDRWQREAQECLALLREAAGGCPACIFAAIRQQGLVPYMLDFDWETESKRWLKDANDSSDTGIGGPGRC
jgi:hypothetical protein